MDERSGAVALDRGEILVVAQRLSTVQVGGHAVTIDGGAIALVRSFDGVLKVRNLYDRANHGVTVYMDGQCVRLRSGQEVVVGATRGQVARSLHADRVSRRGVRTFDMSTAGRLVRSEVSLVSLLQNSAMLSHLLASEDREDKALVGKITKMAACLQAVTARRGAYSQVTP